MKNSQKTHCPKGHEYTQENTYIQPSGARCCKICKRNQSLEFEKNNPGKKYASTEPARQKWKKEHPDYWIRHQKKRHGLSEERYNQILEKQNGVCAICKKPPTPSDPFMIDHDHLCCPGSYSCGRCVRGLIHKTCNWGIGSLKDSPAACRNAAEYLENPPARSL